MCLFVFVLAFVLVCIFVCMLWVGFWHVDDTICACVGYVLDMAWVCVGHNMGMCWERRGMFPVCFQHGHCCFVFEYARIHDMCSSLRVPPVNSRIFHIYTLT